MSEQIMRVKVMHPTEHNTVDIDIPDDMTLSEVISELKEAGFIDTGWAYKAVLANGEEERELDLKKTLAENGVVENEMIRLVVTAPLCEEEKRVPKTWELTGIKVKHPTSSQTIDADIPEDMTIEDIISELKEAGFIDTGWAYKAVLADGEEERELDMKKTLAQNGVVDNKMIRLETDVRLSQDLL